METELDAHISLLLACFWAVSIAGGVLGRTCTFRDKFGRAILVRLTRTEFNQSQRYYQIHS